MEILEIYNNRKKYLDLLLLADEQENMVERYISRGTMYAVYDNGIRAVCIVTDEGHNILEIKNIAVIPEYQRHGYGKTLIKYIINKYKDNYRILQVGTGDSPLTIPFYEKCGFKKSHIVKNFFLDNYDHPIFECGKQLTDMIYFQMKL